MNPIWKDYYYMLTDTLEDFPSGCRYRVLVNGLVIFEGRAYPRPAETELTVRLNDILEPYLETHLPIEEADFDNIGCSVEVWNGTSWTSSQPIRFCRDWSYDRSIVSPGSDYSGRPILRRVHPLQYLPVWTDDGVFDIDLHYADAVGDYNNDYSSDYFVTGERTELEEASYHSNWNFFNMRDYLGAVSVVANGNTYPVQGCERFILYYVNAYGGWDWLPVEGKTRESDTVTRHTFETVYNNIPVYARGRFNNVNELTHHYTFYTGWLTDAQSELMPQLLNATTVYVHDTKTNEVLPLVLTNSSTEHKQNGLNQYTIEADLAQNRLRR